MVAELLMKSARSQRVKVSDVRGGSRMESRQNQPRCRKDDMGYESSTRAMIMGRNIRRSVDRGA